MRTVKTGKSKNPPRRKSSTSSNPANNKRSTTMNIVFTAIPIPSENPTSPFLYSFLSG